jgi:DNA-directed RNA polymerase specialized sigma24 family protein
VRDDPHVIALVTGASGGNQDARHELVDRYAPLVYTICTRYRPSNHDIEDVGQNVWLLLVEQLGKLREPAALPGWLATTTARECLRVVTAMSKAGRLGTGLDDSVLFVADTMIDEEILVAERNAVIHAELGIPVDSIGPVGSIGPQRARCLERLRRSDVLAALAEGEEKIDIRGGERGA